MLYAGATFFALVTIGDLVDDDPFHLLWPVLAAACFWGGRRITRPPGDFGVPLKTWTRLSLLPSEESGKLAGIYPRDNLRLRPPGSEREVVVQIAPGGSPLNPGGSGEHVLWVRDASASDMFDPDGKLEIWDSGRMIGSAEVLARSEGP